MNIRPFTEALRKHNKAWTRTFESRAGGNRVVIYSLTLNKIRELRLQLWEDGKHRISHSIKGRTTTTPTEFETVQEMLLAIKVETLRCDNENLTVIGN